MNKIATILLIVLFSLCACQSDSTKKTTTESKTTAAAAKPAKSNSINPDIKRVLQELLPLCEKVEYVFYKEGLSFSTETSGQQATLSYYNFISDVEAPKHNCKYDGGAVFRSPEGDIILTADFVLFDEKCKSFVVTANNKVYYQKINDDGYKYLMQFANLKMG